MIQQVGTALSILKDGDMVVLESFPTPCLFDRVTLTPEQAYSLARILVEEASKGRMKADIVPVGARTKRRS